MAILNSIANSLGMGTAHTSASTLGTNVVSTGQAGQIYLSNSASQSYWGMTNDVNNKLTTLQAYCELVGDEVEYIRWKPNMKTEDAKVSILKITPVGDVIKNVGMRTDENSYYVVREKGE